MAGAGSDIDPSVTPSGPGCEECLAGRRAGMVVSPRVPRDWQRHLS